MLAPLLLLIYHRTTETTTVNWAWNDRSGQWGGKFPWPASGTFKVSISCGTNLPWNFHLYFYQGTDFRIGVDVNWFPGNKRLGIDCEGQGHGDLYPFEPICGEDGLVTYIVLWLTDIIRIIYKGAVIAEKNKDGLCLTQPDGWKLYLGRSGYEGTVTATDEYIWRTADEG